MNYILRRIKDELIEITDIQVEEIFYHYLRKLKNERWVDEKRGKLMEEQYTSHRFDADCDDQSDYNLVLAIQRLEDELNKRKKKVKK